MRYYLYSVSEVESLFGKDSKLDFSKLKRLLQVLNSIVVIARLSSSRNLIQIYYLNFFQKYIDILQFKGRKNFPFITFTASEKRKELLKFFKNNQTRLKEDGTIGNNYEIMNSNGTIFEPLDFLKFMDEWNSIYIELNQKKKNAKLRTNS